jgi:hypothetical protein
MLLRLSPTSLTGPSSTSFFFLQSKQGVLKPLEELPWEIELLQSASRRAYGFVSPVCRAIYCSLLLPSQYESTVIHWNTLQTVGNVKHAMAVCLRLAMHLFDEVSPVASEEAVQQIEVATLDGSHPPLPDVFVEQLRLDFRRRLALFKALEDPLLPPRVEHRYLPVQSLSSGNLGSLSCELVTCLGAFRVIKTAVKPDAPPTRRLSSDVEDPAKELVCFRPFFFNPLPLLLSLKIHVVCRKCYETRRALCLR